MLLCRIEKRMLELKKEINNKGKEIADRGLNRPLTTEMLDRMVKSENEPLIKELDMLEQKRKFKLDKISTFILTIANIILASFAIFTYYKTGDQFEESMRPYIGFESGYDSAKKIITGTTYDSDAGKNWLPEDVGAGVTFSLNLKNYGQTPANFEVIATSSYGEILPYEVQPDIIMPNQILNQKWNYKWSNAVPDIKKELLVFKILYSKPDTKEKYATTIEGSFIKLPTKDIKEAEQYPYRLSYLNGDVFILDFRLK